MTGLAKGYRTFVIKASLRNCTWPAKSLRPCGSWLASDGGGSVNQAGGCADPIAGKPAPTGIRGGMKIRRRGRPSALHRCVTFA
ncbi:hypothetical protein EGJ53_03390 [Pseudomonas fluorescens]|nr:hypothetical protein EGJ53_03390 [Pseudomonas fluorescens]